LAEDQLKYYNKILKQQVAELEEELEQLQMQLQAMSGRQSYYISSPTQIEMQLTSDINALKRDIKDLKKDTKELQDNDTLRLWLKNYKIKRAGRGDFDDMF
jgi:predicted RNase H-like nuclease (RuvC/YqgF family)